MLASTKTRLAKTRTTCVKNLSKTTKYYFAMNFLDLFKSKAAKSAAVKTCASKLPKLRLPTSDGNLTRLATIGNDTQLKSTRIRTSLT